MTIQVIGAGLGRTGTLSLKVALEQLLGGPCYHMVELFKHPEHVQVWEQALDGHTPDWDTLFAGYRATGDWTAPPSLPSLPTPTLTRSSSCPCVTPTTGGAASATPWSNSLQSEVDPADPWERALAPARQLTIRLLAERFTPDWADEVGSQSGVRTPQRRRPGRNPAWPTRRVAARGRLEADLCRTRTARAADPFPHVNTTADFRAGRFEK